MKSAAVKFEPAKRASANLRANALAVRLEKGASALAALASGLNEAQWRTRISDTDARTVGVVVHHVGTMYPLEIQLAQRIASGQPVQGVTNDDVNVINAKHAKEYAGTTQEAALELLQTNSSAAAAAIRDLSDEELDRAALASLYDDAPITSQFMLEDHAVRHSYHHFAKIRKALKL